MPKLKTSFQPGPAPALPAPRRKAALCQHTLIEFHGCDPARIERAKDVKTLMVRAVAAGRGTIVKTIFHNFNPYGVSGVVIITESHVTIHTWPEHGYAAVDVFSCSRTLDHAVIRASLQRDLKAKRSSAKSLPRGLVSTKPRLRC